MKKIRIFFITALVIMACFVTTLAIGQVTAQLTKAPNVPKPLNRGPTTVQVEFETVETEGPLHDGVKYRFWTFNGTVPGPMVRVKIGRASCRERV